MLRSFWFHKSLKTQKKSAKERGILFKEPYPSIPPFLGKERCVLCVLLRSFEKNAMFFAFFYVLLKRTQRSLRSFTFFRKERKRTQRFFGFHKSPKTLKKESKRTLRYLNERKRMMRSERKRMMHSERKRTRSPTLRIITVRGPDLHCTPLPHMESEALTARRSSPRSQ